jgi:peptide/nickel transport system substrate-binding protein
MTSLASDQVSSAPLLVFFPGLAIMTLALGFNLLGDGSRDALDPLIGTATTRSLGALGIWLLIVGLTTSCRGSASTPTEEPLTPATPTTPPTQTIRPTVVPEPAPVRKSVFSFGRSRDSVILDPAITADYESYRVTGQCLESLYQYEPHSTNPIPALAVGCQSSQKATVWTCTLREGVKFHDGTDFDADAVLFNFERWRFSDHPHHTEGQVFESYRYVWGGLDDSSVITSATKLNDYKIKFTLTEPMAPFLANLAMDAFAISSPAAIQEYGEAYGLPGTGCIGTGPFKFREWVQGDHITVEAFEGYWGGRPAVDEVTWRVIPDDAFRFLALKGGDIHAMDHLTVQDLAAAEADPNLTVLTRSTLNTGQLAFNYMIEEFRDVRVREAVAHAINRQALVEGPQRGAGDVARNPLPSVMWGHHDEARDWTYDPGLSRQLLSDAGFPDGLGEVTIAEDILDEEEEAIFDAGDKITLTLHYAPVARSDYVSPKDISESIAADLAQVGISVTLEPARDWPTYQALKNEGLLLGMYLRSWGNGTLGSGGENGDPDSYYNTSFGLESEDREGSSDTWEKAPRASEGWWADTEIARLCYEASVNPDRAARETLYVQIEQLLRNNTYRIWLTHGNAPLVFSNRVSGFVPQPVGADYYEWVTVQD